MKLRLRYFILSLSLFSGASVSAQSLKYEFRGAWIATVLNLDWPSSTNPEQQRTQLIDILDKLAAAGINAVVFQVRPECDALYNSPYEPWSYWLTGLQGTPPNPYYDPLEFAVQEAHKRGMELHAWFNPYRAERSVGAYPLAESHVVRQHPDWTLTVGSLRFLNPGLQEVRDHVTKVIADVVRRYNVDGVHMDDYFYPYPPNQITTEDAATFAAYPRGFTQIGDWRRDNVNLLIRQIYDSVQAIRPVVKFGMSPFGIWRNGVPPGISGMDAYSTIYCDALAWLRGRYIDYITPQLYWAFGGGQDYATLQPWWGDSARAYGRHYYTGNATYRLIDSNWPASEIGNQLRFNRMRANAQGSIQFRAANIRNNTKGIADSLRTDIFLYPSLIPPMQWKERVPPNAPTNLRAELDPATQIATLRWNSPSSAADGDTARRYAVYRFTSASPTALDREYYKHLIAVSPTTSVVPSSRVDTGGVQYYFGVAAVDANNNESDLTFPLLTLPTPVASTALASPLDGESVSPQVTLRWRRTEGARGYRLEVASQPWFDGPSLLYARSLTDTFATVTGHKAQEFYYWRVAAGAQGAAGEYSETRAFKGGWPLAPSPVSPHLITSAPLRPTFRWTSSAGANTYRVRVASGNWTTGTVVLDTTVADTFVVSNKDLPAGPNLYWRVLASNAFGLSDWSTEAVFRSSITSLADAVEGLPLDYELSQNYPNPFNASTRIRFALPSEAIATLTVYDVLGRQVAQLVNEMLPAGVYEARLDAEALSSGTYIYVLNAGHVRLSRKMVLLK